jgi:hypothetical protein
MRLLTAIAAFLVALAPAAAAPPETPPPGTVAVEGGLRHEKAGIVFPDRLEDMTRVITGDKMIVALYLPSDLRLMLAGKAVILGVTAMPEGMSFEKMGEFARGSFHETGVANVVSEKRFLWAGHPDAITFHGVYTVSRYRKEYWRAWDKGWDATVIVTTPRTDLALGERLSKLIADKFYGGATIVE